MLARHMAGYAPSLIVTAFFSFISVTLFTSLMSQAEYGHYALTITTMTMLVGVGFSWLQNASSRLLPQAVAEGREEQFLATLYGIFLAASLGLGVVSVVCILSATVQDLYVASRFAVPLTILRSFLNINQSVHRNHIRINRYNIIEIGQSIIGFVLSFALVYGVHKGASGAAMGMMLGLAALSLYDWRMLTCIKWRNFDWMVFRDITHFGIPFIVTYGLSFILSSSDRFLIDYFLGPAQVGIYSAGYAFPDRIGQNIFMAVATASFPLVVRKLEHEGVESARAQTYTNGVAVLALAFPACMGLLLVNHLIAATLIGADFREGAAMIMPYIAVAMVFNGIAAHYFDHAFHLAKKTRLFFFTLGPAAAVNFIGNLYAIPRFGIIGAAYTTLVAYTLYLVLSIIVGRRVFAIRFPFKPALQIAISTGIMAAVLSAFDVSPTLFGLAVKVAAGAIVYSLCLLAFNVMFVRTRILARLIPTRIHLPAQIPAMDYAVITSTADLETLAAEWQDLYHRAGSPVFGDYDWFALWLRHLGSVQKQKICILTARDASGILRALLPLSMRRMAWARVAVWAGYDVFDYGDIVADGADAASALWRFASAWGYHDIARIGSIHDHAASLPSLTFLMKIYHQHKNYFVTLSGQAGMGQTGEQWLAAQSRKLRGDTRRKIEKMQVQGGAVVFHVHKNSDSVPADIVETLYRQKQTWFKEKKAVGVFAYQEMQAFLHDLVQDAAKKNKLYLAWLSCGDKIVACHMGFVREGILYLYLTTYDAAFGVFSPGNALMIETIKWAADHHFREVDFMRGDESYKQRFATDTRTLTTFILGRSIYGRLLVFLRSLRRAPNV